MTISEPLATTFRYQGNGVTDTFAYNARVFTSADLIVEIITRATDVLEDTLTLTTDYTVTIADDGTASVVVVTPPTASQDIQLRRSITKAQTTELPTGTRFPAATVEETLDKITAITQDLQAGLNLAATLPANSSATSAVLPLPVDGSLIAWDGTDGTMQNLTLADLDLSLDTVITGAANNDFLVYNGTAWANEAAADARASLGLGTLATLSSVGASNIASTFITGQTDATLAYDDTFLIGDTSASGAPKEAVISEVTAFAPPMGNKIAPHENLVIYRGSATQITITADSAVLKNASGFYRRFTTFSTSIDITVSGAAGLDTGAEANSTWYYIWLLAKTDGTKTAVLSTSATAPTLPSGYTYYGRMGAVYNNGSGDLVEFRQLGNRVTLSVQSPLSDGTATTFTAVNLSAICPPIATAVQFEYGVRASSGTATVAIVVAAGGSGTTPFYGYCKHSQLTGSTTVTYANASLVFNTAIELYYYVSGANARGYIDVNGWFY